MRRTSEEVPLPLSDVANDEGSGGVDSQVAFAEESGMRVSRYFRYFTLFLCPWTLCLLHVRLRNPRKPIRDLVGCFGASACFTVTVLLVARAALFALTELSQALSTGEYYFNWTWEFRDLGGYAGPTIAGSWLVLLLLREHRLEKSWIEISGMLLAGCWIFLYLEPAIVPLIRL